MTVLRTAAGAEQRTPFHFGSPSQPLFGCYHAPAAGPWRNCGVVLCYPFGQEYIRSHRSFVQLAARLAARGFAVLRFDYFGTGDSAGASTDGGVERWLVDIAAAVSEVRQRANAPGVALVGLRLGALLAAHYAATVGDVESLVLWDPVASGTAYLDDLRRQQQTLFRHAYLTPNGDGGNELGEVLGFPLSAGMRGELVALDLLSLDARMAENVLLMQSPRRPDTGRFTAHLSARAGAFDEERVVEHQVWLMEPSRGIVPRRLLEAIVAWMDRVHA